MTSLVSLSLALIWLLLAGPRRGVAAREEPCGRPRRAASPVPNQRPYVSPEARLATSIGRLRNQSPEMSAGSTLTRRQQLGLAALLLAVVVSLVAAPVFTLQALVAAATVVYMAELSYRVILFRSALRHRTEVAITDAQARAIPDRMLPTYTVLAAVYREPELVETLLRALDALEYPKARLDVKLILEADDEVTIAAVSSMHRRHVEVVLVPPAEPRTKPKALNYGLTLARGEFVTVYDAEDRPEPLQLRRAVVAFRRAQPDLACLQAKLSFYNPRQNLITRWFTAEYSMWFSFFLPGLIALGAPVPLGGTSNHFIRKRLEEAGGWDPYNVTEDADLGVRLARRGWRVGLLDSTTEEEANSDFINWMKQRSRWYKGYLQTWLVHMRHPVRFTREVGLRSSAGFSLFVGGTPVLALLNSIFLALALVWFTARPAFIQDLFPGWIYYSSLLTWVAGNFAVVYANMISARATGKDYLVVSALLSPAYWLMMSVAAVKALLQLVIAPAFWEKTRHGLGPPKEPAEERFAS